MAFLKSLSLLAASGDPHSPEERHLRERVAASALFNWEKELYVARAPGRLDVMGGIADYSGSLVLQVTFTLF
jgi:L-arabinokinase